MIITKNDIKNSTSIDLGGTGRADDTVEVLELTGSYVGTAVKTNAGTQIFEDRFSTEEIIAALKGESEDAEEILGTGDFSDVSFE